MAISRSQMPMQVSPSFEEEGGIRYLNGGGTARDPYSGQGSRMFANILGNQMGFRNAPFVGQRLTNLADTGFQRAGRRLQFLPGARQFGNLLNRVGRRANQFTNFRDRFNPVTRLINPQRGGLFGLRGRGGPLGFGLINRTQAPRQTSGTGLFGLRGKGGLLGFGLLGRRGGSRQASRQQYGGSPSMLGSGAFASSYTPKIGEDVVTGRQDSSTRNSPNYTGTIESGDFDPFAGQGPIGPGMDLDSYGFGQSIQRPDATGIAEEVNRQVMESLPFYQQNISLPEGEFYRLINKETGQEIMSGRQHKDYRPRVPSFSRMGGSL